MPRIKGRSYRQATPQRASDRQAQVREQLAAGVQNPAAIAKALGVSKEAVIYHARKMNDVELVHDAKDRRRTTLRLITTHATGAAA